MLNLKITREHQNGHGQRISGQETDKNGERIKEDGFVAYDGNARWRERTVNGDIRLQILSKGRLDLHGKRFFGVWQANNKMFGSFSATATCDIPTAHAIPVITSQSNNGVPLITAENDIKICTASATLLSPTSASYCDAP